MKIKSCLAVLLFLGIALSSSVPTSAGDVLHRLTHNDQYALVLGTVTAIKKEGIILTVSKTLSGHWLWGRINIVNSPAIDVKLKMGTKLLASVDRNENSGARRFSIKWGLYRVSSFHSGTLRILNPDMVPGERAALECYIHSGTKANDFLFIEKAAFLRYSDGTVAQIYPEPKNNRDRSLRKKVLIYCEPKTYSQVLSSTVGIGLYPIFINKVNRPIRYRWRTDYGMFLSWSAATYQVKQLGRETITTAETKIYWSFPLSQEQKGLTNTKLQPDIEGQYAPINNHLKENWHKNRARVELSVMDQKTGKIIEKSVIFIICKEGTATVDR